MLRRTDLRRYKRPPTRRVNKYGNVTCKYNGRTYHSRKEADYAAQLDLLKKSKLEHERVISWKPQVREPLVVEGVVVCTYVVDFKVGFADGRVEWHEVKGFETDLWNLKRKIWEATRPKDKLVVIR